MKCYTTLLVGTIIIIFVISADNTYIVSNKSTESWITIENFTNLIDASFSIPQCVNIFLSDKSAGTELLFKQFIKIYEFEYILNGKVDGCNSFFLVGNSEENLLNDIYSVVTIDSKIEILIVIDNDVNEPMLSDDGDEGIFNTATYLNTNVNIVARNGLWTLSDNFLLSRVFKKVSSYTEMKHKKGIVNLEGEELQVTTFYNPPLCYLETTVTQIVNNIEVEFFSEIDEFDGVELILFGLFAERLNFTYRLRKPPDEDPYGSPNGSVWSGGIIGQMFREETHFGFGGVWITREGYYFANLTVPWGQIYVQFLVPRPKPHASFWALTTTLTPEVWVTIIAIVIVQSLCIYTRAWLNPRVPKRYRSFTNTWTEIMARLVGTSAPRKIHGIKFECMLCHFFGVLVVTAYSSSLAAKLASRGYDKRIDTVQDFVKANLTWGRKIPPMFSVYFDYTNPYAAIIPEKFQNIHNDDETHANILKGNYAIFGRRIASTFFPDDPVSNKDLKGYRLMRNAINNRFATFVVAPWLIEPVNKLLLWMQETGLVQYHLNDVLYRRTPSELREVLNEHDVNTGEPRVLILTPLGAGFAMYIMGLFISTVVFYIELLSVKGKRSICAVLLDIKKKRDTSGKKKTSKEYEKKFYSRN